jgi:hypothetical protein
MAGVVWFCAGRLKHRTQAKGDKNLILPGQARMPVPNYVVGFRRAL